MQLNTITFDATQLENFLFVLNVTEESVDCFLFFLKNMAKHFCNLTHKKTSSSTLKIYRIIF